MRYVALDLGDKRTGIALGDDASRLASPLDVVEVPLVRREGDDLIAALSRLLDREVGHTPFTFVLGLPLDMDTGREGPRAALTRRFGERLALVTGRPVLYHDERLTTDAARWSLAGLSRAGKKARKDAVAAAAILSDFFSTRDPPRANDPPQGGAFT